MHIKRRNSSLIAKSSTASILALTLASTSVLAAGITAERPPTHKTSCEISLEGETLHNPELVDLDDDQIVEALVRFNSLNPHKGDIASYKLSMEQKGYLEDLIKTKGRSKAEQLLTTAFERSKEFITIDSNVTNEAQAQAMSRSFAQALLLVQKNPDIAKKAVDIVVGEENILFNQSSIQLFETILRSKNLLASDRDLRGKGLIFSNKKKAIDTYEQDKLRLEGLHQLDIKDQTQLASELYTSLFEKQMILGEKSLGINSTDLAKELTATAKSFGIKLKEVSSVREELREILQKKGGREFMVELIRVSLPTYGKLLLGTRPSKATRNAIYWTTYGTQFALSGLLALATKDAGYLALGAAAPLATSWVPGIFHGTSVKLSSKIQNWLVRREIKNLLQHLIDKNELTPDGTIINGDFTVIESKQNQLEAEYFRDYITELKPKLSATTNTFEIQKYGEDILYARTLLATRFFTETANRGTFHAEDLALLEKTISSLELSNEHDISGDVVKDLSNSLQRRKAQLMGLVEDAETLLADTHSAQLKMEEFDNYLSEEIDIFTREDDPFFKTSEEIFFQKQKGIRQAADDLKNLTEKTDSFRGSVNQEISNIDESIRLITVIQKDQGSDEKAELLIHLQQLVALLKQVSLGN